MNVWTRTYEFVAPAPVGDTMMCVPVVHAVVNRAYVAYPLASTHPLSSPRIPSVEKMPNGVAHTSLWIVNLDMPPVRPAVSSEQYYPVTPCVDGSAGVRSRVNTVMF